MNFSDLVTVIPAVVAFMTQHWDSIVAVCTALVMLFQAAKKKEYDKLWPATLELVKQLAEKELSGVEKRKEVAAGIHDLLPIWLKPLTSETQVEKLAEQAYQFMRGELKQQNK